MKPTEWAWREDEMRMNLQPSAQSRAVAVVVVMEYVAPGFSPELTPLPSLRWGSPGRECLGPVDLSGPEASASRGAFVKMQILRPNLDLLNWRP